jgi:hypothetical protein
MVTSMKRALSWDAAPCSPVDTDLHHNNDDGGIKPLANISQYLPEYMVQHLRRPDICNEEKVFEAIQTV